MRRSPHPSFTDLPFLIVGLSLGFQALVKRLRAEAGLREDVAVGMGSIFFALCEEEGCIMKDLAARLRMPKGTLSGLIVRMEGMGLIERWQCPHDGRAQRCGSRKARAMEDTLSAAPPGVGSAGWLEGGRSGGTQAAPPASSRTCAQMKLARADGADRSRTAARAVRRLRGAPAKGDESLLPA